MSFCSAFIECTCMNCNLQSDPSCFKCSRVHFDGQTDRRHRQLLSGLVSTWWQVSSLNYVSCGGGKKKKCIVVCVAHDDVEMHSGLINSVGEKKVTIVTTIELMTFYFWWNIQWKPTIIQNVPISVNYHHNSLLPSTGSWSQMNRVTDIKNFLCLLSLVDNFFRHLFADLRSAKTRTWPPPGAAVGKLSEGHQWAFPSASQNTWVRKKACARLRESHAESTQLRTHLLGTCA